MDGNLIEAKVRGQRSIALSSGESEYVAMVSGSIWEFLCGDVPDTVCRTDSSAARGMVGRIGVGRVRHIDA